MSSSCVSKSSKALIEKQRKAAAPILPGPSIAAALASNQHLNGGTRLKVSALHCASTVAVVDPYRSLIAAAHDATNLRISRHRVGIAARLEGRGIGTTLSNARCYIPRNEDNWFLVESHFLQISFHNEEMDRRGEEMVKLLDQENAPSEVYIILYQTLHNLYSIQSRNFADLEFSNGTLSKKGERCQKKAEELAMKYQHMINEMQEHNN